MSDRPNVVSEEELQRLWEDNDIEEKITAGLLYVVELPNTRKQATNPRYVGGVSRVLTIKMRDTHQQIGTIHEIIDGLHQHRHPKDYTLRDCSRVRRPEVP